MISINGKKYLPRCPKCWRYNVGQHFTHIGLIFWNKLTFHIDCPDCGHFDVDGKYLEVNDEMAYIRKQR